MTNNEPQQTPYPQNYPPYEDEINLIDYLLVLWKWKWLIIAGTLICAVVSAVISLQMPEIYKISTVIEPGVIGVDNSENYTYMNSKNISGKINEGAYNKSTKKLLKKNPSKTNLEFKADVGKFTNQIRISAEYKEKDVDLGLEASRKLIAIISDDYKKVVEQRKNDYNRQIAEKQNEISKIETQERKDIDKQVTLKLNNIKGKRNQIKLQQEILEIARQRIKDLELEAKKNKDNTEKIIKQRDILQQDNRTRADISLLLYSTMIQQNVSYSSRLGNQIYNLRANVQVKEANIEELKVDAGFIRTEIEELKLRRTEGLQAKINNVKIQINALTSEKGNISNVKVLQNPEVSSIPVKSKKKQIVLLSMVVGLFFMIFLAFFIEYIKNATRSTKQTTE